MNSQSILAQLQQQLGGDAMKQISQQLNLNEQTASQTISNALPLLLGGLEKNASKEEGAEALKSALEKDHDGSILNNLSDFLSQPDLQTGKGILGHVFGESQENMVSTLGKMSGVDQGKAQQLLSMIAPVVMGQIGKTKQEQNVSADALGQLLGQEKQKAAQEAPADTDLFQKILDRNNDGSIMDDITDIGGQLLGGFFK